MRGFYVIFSKILFLNDDRKVKIENRIGDDRNKIIHFNTSDLFHL